MNSSLLRLVLVLWIGIHVVPQGSAAGTNTSRTIPGGIHRPVLRGPDDPREIAVPAFGLDALPVTNGDFLEFVRQQPRWRRSQVKRLFADENYLRHWQGDLDIGSTNAQVLGQPVTHVSWFAAKAYAAWRGGRLPTTTEWEYAASAGLRTAMLTNDPAYRRQIVTWYSTPSPASLPPVGLTPANFHGIHDLHGLVWEWTSDFNSALVTGDSRGDTGIDRQLFCGAGAMDGAARDDFPTYLRYGFRSSLKAAYTVHNLGFRAAYTLAPYTP
jgi:formylglycine-generating enzyme required for sulfatase activity